MWQAKQATLTTFELMKIKFSQILSLWIIIIPCILYGQNKNNTNDTIVYTEVDYWPELVTPAKTYKFSELKEFVKLKLEYPVNGDDCIGSVFISFIVEKDGTISNKEYLKKLCPGFDENAMKVVDKMTTWIPGKKNNKAIRTKIIIPIKWHLE